MTKFKGTPPKDFFGRLKKGVGDVINTEMLELERELVKKTPVGVSGNLRQRWQYIPWNGKSAIISQSQSYYLPVELGRKPGKGISEAGQRSVARWAKLKLGLSPKDAKSFAYLLSQKYKRSGRPPNPIADLNPNQEPKVGGTVDKAFKEIERGLNQL